MRSCSWCWNLPYGVIWKLPSRNNWSNNLWILQRRWGLFCLATRGLFCMSIPIRLDGNLKKKKKPSKVVDLHAFASWDKGRDHFMDANVLDIWNILSTRFPHLCIAADVGFFLFFFFQSFLPYFQGFLPILNFSAWKVTRVFVLQVTWT